MKKLLTTSLFLLIAGAFNASAQIVTSKQEAQKKGIYSYSGNNVSSQAQSASATLASQRASQIKKDEVLFLDNDVVAVYDEQPVKEKAKSGSKKTQAPTKTKKKRFVINDAPDPNYVAAPQENYFAQQIVNNAMQFEGVRYRGGGTTPAGMDCSGMVYATFQIFDVTLPRSSADMAANAGHEIQLNEVKKGDLLFFDNNPRRTRVNHVGLVTEVTEEGEIKFIHASSSQGVMVSSMNEDYHARTFVKANRVIEE